MGEAFGRRWRILGRKYKFWKFGNKLFGVSGSELARPRDVGLLCLSSTALSCVPSSVLSLFGDWKGEKRNN